MIREMRIRNYSERTIRSYISILAQFSTYYKRSPDQLSLNQLKDYARYLLEVKKIAHSTINQLISAWKILQVDILGHPWEPFRLKRPRLQKRLPEVLSQAETKRLVNAPRNLKHRTLLQLTYLCGLRRSEVLHLQPGDIDAGRKVVRVVHGKGNKSREIPISLSFIEQLRAYYRLYRPKTYLFEGYVAGQPYSETSFSHVIKKAAQLAGIQKKVFPHVLRHCFATHLLERGLNLKRVQLLLGHNAMKTTSVYLHLAAPAEGEMPDLLDTPLT